MPTIKWSQGVITTLLDVELNALASNAAAEDAAFYDNATNDYIWGDFELVLASLTPTGTPTIELYILPALDGTNYPDRTLTATAVLPASCFRGVFVPTTSAGAKRLYLGGIVLPPSIFKAALMNKTGVALGATLNTLKFTPYYEQSL